MERAARNPVGGDAVEVLGEVELIAEQWEKSYSDVRRKYIWIALMRVVGRSPRLTGLDFNAALMAVQSGESAGKDWRKRERSAVTAIGSSGPGSPVRVAARRKRKAVFMGR